MMPPDTSPFHLTIIDEGLWPLDFGEVTLVSPAEVPQPYRRLLVHHHHMTVTVEDHYGEQVNVVVMATRRDGDSYSREILLELQSTRKVVQFGIVRINLTCLSESVRSAILEEKTPLGRVLIEHGVLRYIEPTAFLRIAPKAKLIAWLDLDEPQPCYGRMGVIFCDDRPAIAVLEILTPVN
jgi:hypothetical protein